MNAPSLTLARSVHRASHPAYDRVHARLTPAILLAALTFNAALCFVNTVVLPVSDVMVMGSELLLVATALALALDRRIEPYLVLGLFVSYACLLMALRPGLDPKTVRDFLIPVTFYALGRRRPDLGIADGAAFWSGLVVLAFGLFEYLAFDTFQAFFNIIKYYVARGSVAPAELANQAGSTLFVSGVRPDARNILPFLGPHRVSSVFLEPVSTGNFGAILYMWALVRRDMRRRWATMALAAAAIVLSDARFGLYVCVAATLVLPVARVVPRVVWFALPFAIMTALAIYGFESAEMRWQNDIGGRLLWTARLLTSLTPAAVMGMSPEKPFLADSGYATVLNEVGLVGFVAFWALFIFVPAANPEGQRLRTAVAIYLCLLLVISDSVFSIKTAALLWYMLGALARPPDLSPVPLAHRKG